MENYGAVISNNYGAMMNLQQCLSQEMLTADSPKRGQRSQKSPNRDRAILLPCSDNHGKWM